MSQCCPPPIQERHHGGAYLRGSSPRRAHTQQQMLPKLQLAWWWDSDSPRHELTYYGGDPDHSEVAVEFNEQGSILFHQILFPSMI